MKKLFHDVISKIQPKKKRKKHSPSKICLNESKRDNYRSKRKQLKINFWWIQFFNIFKKYKNIIYFTLFPLTILFFTFILFWPIFTVQNIQVLRNDNITEMGLAYSSLENIREKRIFQLDEEVIKSKMKEYQNNIKNIDISFDLPDTIEIKIDSYPIYFNTLVNNKSYYLTQNGTLVPGKNRAEYKNISIKKKLSSTSIPDYNKLFYTEHIEEMYNAYNFLEENIIDIKVDLIDYYPIEREAHFHLNNEVLLIYTLWRSMNEQIEKTVIYNTEHNSLSDNSIIYIDFRVREEVGENKKEKIFYYTRETEYQCIQNLKKIYSLYE